MPCTTILVGKKATYDGSTMMARNEDSGPDHFTAKNFIVVRPEDQPRHYRSVLTAFEMDLPEEPMRYTAMPNALPNDGVWGEAGFNSCNVAMSETETLTSNPRVLGADPLVKDGIGEEDMLTITLPYIHSAREGVLRLGSLLEKYGTCEMNGIGFQDADELWWFESVGGHHWMAKRVPDDCYIVAPNQQSLDFLDLKDAYGEKKENLCDAGMIRFIRENHLDLDMRELPLEEVTDFDVRAALGSHSDADHSYNTPRSWYMGRCLSRNAYTWDGPDADITPETDDIPFCFVPDHKVTVEDIKYVLSSYYQGTPFNPYDRHGDPAQQGKFRPIGINRNNFVAITQMRNDVPASCAAVEWIAVGSNAFNTAMPFYANVDSTPEYMSNAGAKVDTGNYYWQSRLIGALADAHFAKCIAHVERYQLKTAAMGHNFLKKYEQALPTGTEEEIRAYLTRCNQETSDALQKQTDDLLDKVLLSASLEMKNAFARSDA